jgi:mannitol/fructose-specific phosphotransferase system IIA component (Ntr-type)
VRERAIFEASQFRKQLQKARNEQEIAVTEDAPVPTKPQVAHDARLEKLGVLKKELANLQIVYNSQQEQVQGLENVLVGLSTFFDDEEDAIAALMALQDYESQLLMAVFGIKVT